MENTIKIESKMPRRCYGKGEISEMYGISLNTLRRQIQQNDKLLIALTELDYFPTQRVFTIRQSLLIFHYLGEPEIIETSKESCNENA